MKYITLNSETSIVLAHIVGWEYVNNLSRLYVYVTGGENFSFHDPFRMELEALENAMNTCEENK